MKIDFDMLEKMATAGASAQSIIVMLRAMDAKKAPKRTKDKAAKAAAAKVKRDAKAIEIARPEANDGESERKSTIDSERYRIFALRPRLVALGLNPTRAGTVLGQWCKLSRDNAEAIESAVVEAEHKRPADPIGYVRACLQQRSTINGHRDATMAACDDLIARTAPGYVEDSPPMRDITPRSS